MKILCFTDDTNFNNEVVQILKGNDCDLQLISSTKNLNEQVSQDFMNKSIIMYYVYNKNFHTCYDSLTKIHRMQPSIFLRPHIFILIDKNLNNNFQDKLFSFSNNNILINYNEINNIYERICEKTNFRKKTTSNDNDAELSDLLYRMKNQLIIVRNSLINGDSIDQTNIDIITSLQTKLLELNKFLIKNEKNLESSFINVSNLLKKIFAYHGWSNVNHHSNLLVNTIEAHYEYFVKAMEDLIEKLIKIAGSQEMLMVQEIVRKDYLIINFTIKNITQPPQSLLDYKNFDFCQKVLNLHAGDFFIKLDNDSAYVTCRLPVAI